MRILKFAVLVDNVIIDGEKVVGRTAAVQKIKRCVGDPDLEVLHQNMKPDN